MNQEDLNQIADSLRHAFLHPEVDAVRRAVDEFGWQELLVEDEHAAVSTLFKAQGECLPHTSFLDEVLLAAAGDALPAESCVVLPQPGAVVPTSRLTSERGVLLDGVVQRGEESLVVPSLDAGGRIAFAVADGVEPVGQETLDTDSGWRLVRREVATAEICLDGPEATQAWDRMTAAGRRALSHELVALGAAMLDMTVSHVKSREQFGRPLATFQAVKHKLADVRLWQECAELAVDAAWDDRGVHSAALAKAAACRFASVARANCQQLLGGMGFTWEHPFHYSLRRSLTLEPLLGGAHAQHAQLGKAIRDGAAPDAFATL